MDIANHLRLLAMDELRYFTIGIGFAPRFLEAHDVCTLAPSDLRKTIGALPVREHRELRSRFHKVGDSGLHPGAARAGKRQRRGVGGSKGSLKQLLNILHYLNKVWVEMPDDRLGQC